MKKTYITPSITTVLLAQTTMIAISNTNVEGLGRNGDTGTAGITEGAAKANNYSVWDDDWSN